MAKNKLWVCGKDKKFVDVVDVADGDAIAVFSDDVDAKLLNNLKEQFVKLGLTKLLIMSLPLDTRIAVFKNAAKKLLSK